MKLRLPKLLKAAILACITASVAFTLGTASAADRTTAAASGVWNAALFGGTWADGDTAKFTNGTGGNFTLSGNIKAGRTELNGRTADTATNNIPWIFDLKKFTLDFGVVVMPLGGGENSPITIKDGAATMTSYQSTNGSHQTWFTVETGASLLIKENAQSAFLNKKGAGSLKIGGNMVFDGTDNQFRIAGGGFVELVGIIVGGATGGNFATITGGSALILHSNFADTGAWRNIIFDDAGAGNMLKLDSTGGQTSAGTTVYGNVYAVDAANKNGIIVNVAGNNRIAGGFRFGATETAGSVQVQGGFLTIDGDILATGAYAFNANVAGQGHLIVNNIKGAIGKLNAAKKSGAGTMTIKGRYDGAGVFELDGGKLILEDKGVLAVEGANTHINVNLGEFNVRNAATLGNVINKGTISVSHQGVLTINEATTFTSEANSQISVTGGTLKLVSGGNTLSYAGGMTVGGVSTEDNPLFFFDLANHNLVNPLLTLNGALTWSSTESQYFGINFGGTTPTSGTTYTLIQANSLIGTMAQYTASANGFIYTYKLEDKALKVTVTEATRTLIWAGGSGTWQLGGDAQWTDDNNAGFLVGDAVVFGRTGGGGTINLVGSLYPRDILVEGVDNITFEGTGKLNGTTGITKTGTGTLTINTTNTFKGPVLLNGGNLIVGNSSALGTGEGGIIGGGTATLDLRQVQGGFSTSSVNTNIGAVLTILGNLKVSNFEGDFNKGGGTISLSDLSTLTLSPKPAGSTGVTLHNLSGSGTIIYSAGTSELGNKLTLTNVSNDIKIHLVSGRLANYRGDAITLDSKGTPADASLSYTEAGEYSATLNLLIGSGGGSMIFGQVVRFGGNITAVEGTSGNLELTLSKDVTMLGSIKMGGTLKVQGGAETTGELRLSANETNRFEIGTLDLGLSGRLMVGTSNFSVKNEIKMDNGSSIIAQGGAYVIDANVTTNGSYNNVYTLGGSGLSFNTLTTSNGGQNASSAFFEISGNVSFKSTDIGGYGLSVTVSRDAIFNLGSITFANNGVSVVKNGAGTMVITDIKTAADQHKTLAVNAGVVEFNFASGVSAGYGNVISGAGSLKKSGAGILSLSSANTFTGGIELAGGILRAVDTALGGAGFRNISVTGDVILQSSAIGGTMYLNSLSVGTRNTLDIGGIGVAQTISANTVLLGVSSVLRFDIISVAEQDTLVVTDILTLEGGGGVIQLSFGADLVIQGNSFVLIDASKAIINDIWANMSVDQTALGRGITATGAWENKRYSVWLEGGTIDATVTWKGGVGDEHRWVAGGTGWTGTNEKNFKNGDAVIFSDLGAENVTLIGSLNPKNIVVKGGLYTFMGDGSIIGTGFLTLQGASQLTINTLNTYSGGTILEGTSGLVIGSEGALGSGALRVKGTSTLNTTSLVAGYVHAGDTTLDAEAVLTVTGDLSLKKVSNLGTMNINGGKVNIKGAFTSGAASAFHLTRDGVIAFDVLTAEDIFATKISSEGNGHVIFNGTNHKTTLYTDFTGFTGEIEFRPSGNSYYYFNATSFNSTNRAEVTFVVNGVSAYIDTPGGVADTVVRRMNFVFKGSSDGTFNNIGNLSVASKTLTYAGTMTVIAGASARIGSDSSAFTTTIGGNILGGGALQLARASTGTHTFNLSGDNTIAKLVLGGGLNLGAKTGGRTALVYAQSAHALGMHVAFSNNDSELFVDFNKVTVENISSFATGSNKITIMGKDTFEVNTSVATSIFHGVIKNGSVAGDAGILQKSGTGTLTLAGVNTYSGGTIISAGTLALTGAGTLGSGDVKLQGISLNTLATLNLNSSTAVTNHIIISDGSFGTIAGWSQSSKAQIDLGRGSTYVGNLSLGSTQRLNILGTANGAATVSGNLALNGSILNFSLGAGVWNSLTIGGSLTVADKSAINIDLGSSSLNQGKYLLVSTSRTLAVDFVTIHFNLTGVTSTGRRGYTLTLGNGTVGSTSGVYLDVSGGEEKSLTWNGSQDNMSWNGLEGNKNWLEMIIGDTDKSQFYMDGDIVSFTATGAGTVQIADLGVTPKKMIISGGTYTFTGGAIKGGTLSVAGGSVILANNNTSTEQLSIADGVTVTLGNYGTTGDWKGGIVIGAGSRLITNRTDAGLTLSKIITGAGKFVQIGSGTVTIASDRLFAADAGVSDAAFTGGTTVEKGFLTLGTGKAVAGASFQFGTGAIELGNSAQANLQLTSGGAANGYTFTNNWVVKDDATIAYVTGGDRNTLSGTMSIAEGKTLTLASQQSNGMAGANVVSGVISGAGSLALTGGTVTNEGTRRVELAGVNTFTGAISVTNNSFMGSLELVLTKAQAASTASGIVLSSTETQQAKLVLGVDMTLKGLSSVDAWSSVSAQGTGLRTLTLGDTNASTFAGQISGNLAIKKTGAGVWALSGANSYTGGTTIAGGTISVGHLEALGTEGLVSLAGGTLSIDVASFARDLTVSSGTNTLTGTAAATYAGKITLNSSTGTSTLILDAKDFGARITSTGGTNTLNNATAFTGDLSVSAGSLVLGSGLGAGNAIALSGGATLNVNDQAVSRDLAVSGSGTLSGNINYSGSITLGDSANLTVGDLKLGVAQNLNLGKTSTITGNLNLNGGSLLFDLDTNEPKSWDTLTLTGNLTASNGAKTSFNLNFTGGIKEGDSYLLMTYAGTALSSEVLNTFKISLNVGRTFVSLIPDTNEIGSKTITVKIGNTDSLVWRGGQTEAGSNTWQTQERTSTLDANAPWLVNGAETIPDNRFHVTDAVVFGEAGAGEVKISGLVLPSTITVSAGTYQFVNNDENSGIAGSGSLAVSGTANLSINSVNAQWAGPILLNGGTLTLGATGAFGSGILTYYSGTLGVALGASHSLTDANFKLATKTEVMEVSLGGSLTLSGTMAGLKTLNVAGNGGTLSLGSKAGSFAVNVMNGATLSLSDAAAHTGATNIAGILSTLGNVGGTLNLNSGGQLNLQSGAMTNTINVVGDSILNRVDGTWDKLNLKQGASLTYKVKDTVASLLVTTGQTLTANFGSTLNGVLDLSGGTFKIGIDGISSTATEQTVLSLLNGGKLMTTSKSEIDMTALALTKKGNYTFTLVKNANMIFNLDLLSLKYQGAGMNLVGAPVLVKENGALVLKFEVAASLEWNGTNLSNTWTTDQSVLNWTKEGNEGDKVDAAFGNNDFVVFNDAAQETTVEVVGTTSIGTLRPMSMVVTGAKAYTFGGAGNIIATGALNYSSTGDLTFKNEGINEFLSGITIGNTAGTLKLQGVAGLKGDLSIDSELSIESSVVSQFTNVKGAGNITIKGKGGASLSSSVVGAYTGMVTIHEGILKNSNTLGTAKLSVEASGNVMLTGVNAAHLSQLNTSVAGAQVTGLTGTVTLASATFSLSAETSSQAVVSFTNGSGSLNFGTLVLDFKGGLVFLDDTLTHEFVLTNGILGSRLHEMDTMGKYKNITFTSYQGDPDTYAVMSIDGGTVTIGGTKAYENFVLDVHNQWTPHIASTESANFTSAQFKTFAGTDFASVTIDGRLGLVGDTAFLLNHLSGGTTGKIFVTDGAIITLDATGAHPLGKDNIYKGVFSASKSDVTVTTGKMTRQSLLGSNYMLTLTLSNDSNLILGGYTRIEGKNVNLGGNITKEALTLGSGSTLTFAEGGFTEVNGNVVLGTGAKLTGSGTLSILAGNKLSLGEGSIVDGTLVINLESASGDTGTLEVGTATITLGGITGGGFVNADTGSLITLNVTDDAIFTGTLSGSGAEGAPQTGSIVKTGAGNQVLAGKTDKFNLYDLTVNEGTLTLKGSGADYHDLVVGSIGSKTRAVPAEGHMNVESKITAQSLLVNENGVLTIGSASGGTASITVAELAQFITGSEMVVYVSSDNTPLISANSITGLSNLSQVTLNANSYWQANLNVILFQSEEELQDKLNKDNVILSGFGDKNIIYSDDNKTVTISAHRGFDDNPYKNAMAGASQNANAGMDLIWDANVRAGENGANIATDSNLAGIFNSMVFLGSGSEASNRLMAAVAGSSVTVLAGSQRDDFRQQQDWIRNRTTGMGISPDYVHEDLPYVNGWIQANGGTTRVSQEGDEAGYNLDTFGGTFGFDVDLSPKTTWGFAFTANYNKLTTSSAESARGHNDAYYANLFLRTQNKRWANTFILTGGWNDATLDRTVTGPFVNYTAKGSTSGATIGAMYETTYDYVLNENKTRIFQPLLNISFASSSMDAYTEEGAGNAGLKVEETKGTYGTIALGARLLGSVGQSLFGRTALGELRLQIAQDIGDDTNTAKVGLGGIQREVLGSKVGKTALQFGAGISIPVSEEGGSLYFDVNTDFRSNATNVNGNVGYRMNF